MFRASTKQASPRPEAPVTVSAAAAGNADRAPASGAPSPNRPHGEFRLVRYFTVASLAAFVLVAAALIYFQTLERSFFKNVQAEQTRFFRAVQDGFARQQDAAARRDLLAIHEAGNVNLTRLFANALWERDFAPFVAKAQEIPVEACRGIPDVTDGSGKSVAPAEKKACFAEAGARIMAIAGFKALDAKVYGAMKNSTVFKVKVFDLRGVTVYSSEHAQIGEDKAANAGWRAAASGKPASEMTHRDKFSAFEGVVENRDLISSYLPVHAPGSERIVGVFEVYSDVTPFLEQIKGTSANTGKLAAANLAGVEAAGARNQETLDRNANLLAGVVVGLLFLLYLVLFLVVRNAQRIINRQQHEADHAHQRLAQSEKMASLGQMVAGVAHQLNTPLAFTQNNVNLVIDRLRGLEAPVRVARKLNEILRNTPGDRVIVNLASARPHVEAIDASPEDVRTMGEMLRDVLQGIDQMSELVRNMRDFTRLDRAKVTAFDVNRGLRSVVYIAKSVIPNEIDVAEEYGELPEILCSPSQLNQVFLNLITNAAQAIEGSGRITVRSGVEGNRVKVEISDTGAGIPAHVLPHIFDSYYTTKPAGEGTGLGLPIALDIVRTHGGDIEVATEVGAGTTFTIYLPTANEALQEAA